MLRSKLPKKILAVVQLMKEIDEDKQKVLIDRFCEGKSLRDVAEDRECSFVYIRELEGKLLKKIADAFKIKL